MLLARHFAARMAHELDWREAPEFSEAVVEALEAHPWRGNVRELKNVVERAVYQAATRKITRVVFDPFQYPYGLLEALSPDQGAPPKPPAVTPGAQAGENANPFEKPFREAVDCFEREMVRKALECARFNQRQAAKLLGLSYHQFRGLYRKHQDPR